MSINFLVAPDFAPESFSGWYMLSTLLQRRTSIRLHLIMPGDSAEQTALLDDGDVDLIYANPFDAAALVRDRGYRAFARPARHADEVIVATSVGNGMSRIEDLDADRTIGLTRNHDVKLIGLRLIEPADLKETDLKWRQVDSYQALARQVIEGGVDAGFFLADAFHAFSRLTRDRMKILVESHLCDISHVLLAHPHIAADLVPLREALLDIGHTDSRDSDVLGVLKLKSGFESMEEEDVEFMIDLMDTLLD